MIMANEIKETVNRIELAGVLVDKELNIKTGQEKLQDGSMDEFNYITGTITIRTDDGSEHAIRVYSRELTKNGTESGLFKGYVTIMEEYKTLKQFPQEADIVKVGGATFGVYDYKKDGVIRKSNNISGKFFNRLEPKDLETTPQKAKFNVEGVIDKIEDVVNKEGVPTGEKKVTLNTIGYNGTIVPVMLTVPTELAQGFASAGYYEGCVTEFEGNIINTVEIRTEQVQVAFGNPQVKTFKNYNKKLEICSGLLPRMLTDIGLDEATYNQCLAKRKMKLDSLTEFGQGNGGQANTQQANNTAFGQPQAFGGQAFGQQNNTPFGQAPQTQAPNISSQPNPFGGNPFGAN